MRRVLEDGVLLELVFLGQRPVHDFLLHEDPDHVPVRGDLVQPLRLEAVDLLQHVVVLVVVWRQHQVDAVGRQCILPLRVICFHRRGVEDRQHALGHIKELLLVQPVSDHVLIVPNLQVLEIVRIQELWVDLPADDLGTNEILLCQDQAHLIEDILSLLPSLHGAERLDLDFLDEAGGFVDLALFLLHVGKHRREAGFLHLHENLALRHLVQRVDEVQTLLLLQPIQPAHG
mmetsp:Transcript_62058/g.116038  ORF Transcript_62058/g.116038 Transcript_62058/m.116038 type:complete len:231 (-) Transcript_62058:403-1095(-)